MSLTGTYTALITPFKQNLDVDYDALKKIIEFQVDAGVEGLVPCGTTGESPTLNHEEHRKVIAKTIEWAKAKNSNIKIIAGTGSNSTREAIALTKAAKEDGADYALQVNPYYNKPTQLGLVTHFRNIAEAGDLPIILYNIPGRTSVSLNIESIVELAGHKNIIGIKEATGDIGFMTQVIHNTPKDFVLLSGDDNLLLPILSIGGQGVISVIANLFPRETGDITRKFLAGNTDYAREKFFNMANLCSAMFLETNPIPVKFAANYLGLCENELRLPMTKLSQRFEEKLETIIDIFKDNK